MKFILWPFKLIFDLIAGIIGLTGRFIGIVLGLVLMVVGIAVTFTIIGGIIGIPMITIGFLILIKAIF